MSEGSTGRPVPLPPTAPSAKAVAAAGLTSTEAARRRQVDGPNSLPRPRPTSPLRLLAAQLSHFFALMLWGAAALAWVGGMPSLAAAIVVVVVVNAGFAFAQEYRADRAAEQLQALLPARATVRRGGHRLVIPAADLVIGDVVLLEAGDRVSADLRVTSGNGLALDESLLTGESEPVRPAEGLTAYAGTFVVEGEAEAVVTAVGSRTRLAAIAALTRRVRVSPGPLAVQLNRVVRAVAIIAVSVGLGFFVVSAVLGMPLDQGFLFAVGVTVALVPEGLLPTVTLSLALAAQRMAKAHALVRRLDAVETLGLTTFICSDKTGTLTLNTMTVVRVWVAGPAAADRGEYLDIAPHEALAPATLTRLQPLALSAVRASTGRMREAATGMRPIGDPMEVALHVLALRCHVDVAAEEAAAPLLRRIPFDARRRRVSVLAGDVLHVKGSPETVLPLCRVSAAADEAVGELSRHGLRVIAVARAGRVGAIDSPVAGLEDRPGEPLDLLGLVALEDPPRPDVPEAVSACRTAGIRLAMVTGDHPATARAVADGVGLRKPEAPVLVGTQLPEDLNELGALIDVDGVVLARVTPEQKLRIARALKARGHIVAMTGDGVNDGPALREADVGVAMGRGGTDTAREAADLILLDDHFATIVAAVQQGRATFSNVRRFLTYHLTDNVAELSPFLLWAASGGSFPLAIGVLQVLALDIGTDLLPALGLGGEPARGRAMATTIAGRGLVDGVLLRRAFGVLGPTEALVALGAFTLVLLADGWSWGTPPPAALLATASGAAFAAIVLGQLANAFACRSETRAVTRTGFRGNRLLLVAVAVELMTLAIFLFLPPVARLLGGSPPTPLGWLLAAAAVPAVWLADALHKGIRARMGRRTRLRDTRPT